MRVVISGGTGFIGSKLIPLLQKRGDEIFVFTRDATRSRSKELNDVTFIEWTPLSSGKWQQTIDGADVVIHLAGKPVVDKRWSASVKREILQSRAVTTKLIVEGILQSENPPAVFISASGVGYYGEVSAPTDEKGIGGEGFLAEVCKEWEAPNSLLQDSNTRSVILRIGVVLGDQGALPKMQLNMRFFSGFGNDSQFLSWIHWKDACEGILYTIDNPQVVGPVNLTAPNPETMRGFTVALAKVMRRPFWIPIPEFMIRLALGEMADAVLIGQNAIPKKLLDCGYSFQYPQLEEALIN